MKTLSAAAMAAAVALVSPTVGAAENEKAPAAAGVPAEYPLKTCPVSGEALGEMGKPVKVSHEGTDVYLCCKSCVKDFNKEPAKYTNMVKEAAAKKKGT